MQITTKPKKILKLNSKILLAIATYYIHYNIQKDKKWDKQADLHAIDKFAVESKLSFGAIAGTFWFTKNNRTYKLNQSSFPLAIED